jgi:hypothetical protein
MHARLVTQGLVWIALGLMVAITPACSSDGDGDGNGSVDGGDPTDGAPTDGDSPLCEGVGLGGECATTAECCAGRLCEDDGSGVRRCIDESFCKGAGLDCTRATDCCSLSCNGTCQDDGSLCAQVGDDCGSDTECCSNDCDGTCQAIGEACSPMGEACSNEGFDEGCCSKSCQNFGTAEDEDLRCARASSCGARGEICSAPADCCSGVCIDGRCPLQSDIGQKNFAGEPCQVDADCASYLCTSEFPGGPKVCQFLGGCRPTGEICTADWQCCSDIHYTGESCPESFGDGVGCVAHGTVEGLSTCADQQAQTGPKEPGELCGDSAGDEVHMCCHGCEQTTVGVWRCEGEGDVCVPDDGACRSASDCCSGICSPFLDEETGETVLRCGPCVPAGGLCTTHGDCCNFVCTDGVCGESDPEDPVCVPLGAGPCAQTSDCCNGDDPNIACLGDVCTWVG